MSSPSFARQSLTHAAGLNRRFWRLLAIWLLALALPLQGQAALAMGFCGPAHHAAPLHAQNPDCLDHGAAGSSSPQEQAAASDTETDIATEIATDHAGSCSVCSDCCQVAAIGLAAPLPSPVDAALPARTLIQLAREGVLLSGLERPPRGPQR